MSEPRVSDRLYDLLPAYHRMRDVDEGRPLQALLRLIGREAQVVEDDLLALYDGWFIETCADWLVPYIGELVAFTPAAAAGDPANLDVSDPRSRLKVLIPRRAVANAIEHRRRKGTLALLEELARDSAGWPARAVEWFRYTAWAENVDHLRIRPYATTSLGNGRDLDDLGGPFDRLAHTVDVRRPNSTLTVGRYDIPSVGLFAWRLRAFTVTHCQAECVEAAGPHRYAFSVLGNDSQLFNVPRPDPATAISQPLELPVAITRRAIPIAGRRFGRSPQATTTASIGASPSGCPTGRSAAPPSRSRARASSPPTSRDGPTRPRRATSRSIRSSAASRSRLVSSRAGTCT